MSRVGSSSWGKLLVIAMLVISVAGGRPSSKSKPTPRQQSCAVYHPGMEGRVGHNEMGMVCCPLGCGQCGGIGCRNNLPRGLSGEDCCVTGVLENQGRCSDRGARAPCIIKGPTRKRSRPTKLRPSKKRPTPRQQSCAAYHPGMEGHVGRNDNGMVCCPLGCGQCGGIGCRKNLPPGLSGKDCCVTGVLQSQGRCSDRGAKAPCIIKESKRKTWGHKSRERMHIGAKH